MPDEFYICTMSNLPAIAALSYPVAIGEDSLLALRQFLSQGSFTQVLVLADSETDRHCYPLVAEILPPHQKVVIPAGESHKHLDTATRVWEAMTDMQMDRKGVLIGIGGGVVGDLGGFAAGVYKRGVSFILLPTTLLSMVDASVGGKTGVDFQGLKNHLGLFHEPKGVYIWPDFLKTLSPREVTSGFAEVVKHYLIRDKSGWPLLREQAFPLQENLTYMIRHSVAIKAAIVLQDPREQNLRKGLNFGHTLGHAVETWLFSTAKPALHGEAVAAGMWMEALLSFQLNLINDEEWAEIKAFIALHFPRLLFPQSAIPEILNLTFQDKKNLGGEVKYTLLKGIGDFCFDQSVPNDTVSAALTTYLSHE